MSKLSDKFVITILPCEVCGNPSVEYVNGETCGCEVCHEQHMNQEQEKIKKAVVTLISDYRLFFWLKKSDLRIV